MTDFPKSDSTGYIKSETLFDFFNSPEFKKIRRKALKQAPLKKDSYVAKGPPSMRSDPEATGHTGKRAQFFADKSKTLKSGHAKHVAHASATPKKKPDTVAAVYADYFSSPAFQKARKKALSYDPFKGATHVAKAPPAPPKKYLAPLKVAKAGSKKHKPLEQPGLMASYVHVPGQGLQFAPAKVVRDQTQVSEMIRSGQVSLMSAVAFYDPKGQMHTGTVLEMFPILPSKAG